MAKTPWPSTELGDHVQLLSGRHVPAQNWNEKGQGTPYLTGPADFPKGKIRVTKYTRTPQVMSQAGDVLVTVKGSGTGKTVVADDAYCISRQLMAVRATSCSEAYLVHLLGYFGEALGHEAAGLIPGISRADLLELEVGLPPLPEQRRIAEILDTVDEAIRKTEEVIAKLEQIKKGLLHDLLTRGIDENGELRDPERHPEEFKDSVVGLIPEGWSVSTVGAEFDMQLGKMLSRAAKKGKNPKAYLGNQAVQWDRVDVSDLPEMDFSPAEQAKFRLQPGDLLVCEGGEVGRTAIWRGEVEDCYFQKAVHRLRPKSSFQPLLMLAFMEFAARTGLFTRFTSATSIAHLTQEKLAAVPLPVMAESEQGRIVKILEAHSARTETTQKEAAKLRLLKKGLMDDLLTGQVRVPVEAEEPV